jgi:hypothetical protein
LRYAYEDGTELHYQVMQGLLQSLELLDRGRVVQLVELEGDGTSRYPSEARYRNLTAFRELTIQRESVESVDAFEPTIWNPSE